MKIGILGAGAFGTAMAFILGKNEANVILIKTKTLIQKTEINDKHTNKKYFPNILLTPNIVATTSLTDLVEVDILFIAVPSKAIVTLFESNEIVFAKSTLIVNLSKGLIKGNYLITDYLQQKLGKEILSLKGGSFANELINFSPTLMTLGFKSKNEKIFVEKLFEGTNIYLDFSNDIKGIEILGILKNIYAIIIGIIDAQFNSANTKFMILTKAFHEYKLLARIMGVSESAIFCSCGIGDFNLTSLNDLSRNRTLGLLIGKGFFYHELIFKNSVIIEGVNCIELLSKYVNEDIKLKLPLFQKLAIFFSEKQNNFTFNFHELISPKEVSIITYGTYDLLHFGHLELLKRAKQLGTRLIVGISTDEFNLEKGKKSIMSFDERKNNVKSIEYVDTIIAESHWEQKVQDIINNDIDIFVIGDDWKGKFDYLKPYCEVVYLPRTDGISSTEIKKILNKD